MSFRINLHSKTYTPGSEVAGTVTFLGDPDLRGKTISITFTGLSYTSVQLDVGDVGDAAMPPSPHCSYEELFSYNKVLYKDQGEPNHHGEWRFKFVFPSKGDSSRPQDH